MKNSVEEGRAVLLVDRRGKKWLVRACRGKRLSLDIGDLDLGVLIGKEYGCQVETHVGEKVWILKPTIEDLVRKFERPTQIVYPKDLGFLLIRSGIKSGSIVVEAGTGSGALTSLLAWFVQPSGHVYSYEVDERFVKVAEKNLEKAGLTEYVTIKRRDISMGIDERDVDAVFLDFGDPWKAIDAVYEALRGGGFLAVITPTYNQAEKVVEALRGRFIDVETVEIFLRKILVRPGKTRPNMRMIGYTALLTTGRKIII